MKVKKLKKAFSLLALLLCVLIATISCAMMVNYNSLNAKADSYVATVVIFSSYSDKSSSSSKGDMGHAFILIENLLDSDIKVGKMTIGGKESVTIGTWGNKSEHKGIWYNLESYYANEHNGYVGRVSTEEDIVKSQLDTINTFIAKHDSWQLLNNCSSFARGLWNSFSDRELHAGSPNTPKNLKKSIQKYKYIENREIKYNSNVGYYKDNNFFNILNTRSNLNLETSFTDEEYMILKQMGVFDD